MALSTSDLDAMIQANLKAEGFELAGKHAFADKLAKAVAKAVVEHIQANAQVPVTGGSSAGVYKVT